MPESTPQPDDNGWYRVTDKDTGHKYSVRESQLAHGNYTVLKSDASDVNGVPLPPEFNAVTPAASTPVKES